MILEICYLLVLGLGGIRGDPSFAPDLQFGMVYYLVVLETRTKDQSCVQLIPLRDTESKK